MELKTTIGTFEFSDLRFDGVAIAFSPFGVYYIAFDKRNDQIYAQIWLGQFPTPDNGWFETYCIPGSKVLIAEALWGNDFTPIYDLAKKDYRERMALAIYRIGQVTLRVGDEQD